MQAIGVLDDEAEEDENFREEHDLGRPQSHEANSDLIVKHSRYLKVLEQASASDKQVREKWNEWRENIEQLCWDEVRVLFPTQCPIIDNLFLGHFRGISALTHDCSWKKLC